ncbi:hypothetical protein MUP95_04225 [bacterium]|nr:hypothetical protein [bacterium]
MRDNIIAVISDGIPFAVFILAVYIFQFIGLKSTIIGRYSYGFDQVMVVIDHSVLL